MTKLYSDLHADGIGQVPSLCFIVNKLFVSLLMYYTDNLICSFLYLILEQPFLLQVQIRDVNLSIFPSM